MKLRSALCAVLLGSLFMHGVPESAQAAPAGKAVKTATANKKKAPAKASAKKVVAKKAATRKASARPAAKKNTVRRAAVRATPVAAAAAAGAGAGAAEAELPLLLDEHGLPRLGSSAFYVVNADSGEVLLERNAATSVPIASITKLMTAMVVLDAGLSLSEVLSIDSNDIDTLKGTGSRLGLGTRLSREEMLQLALMSSENRAASALARHYPGGRTAFIAAMNVKARLLGLWNTEFHDSTGLSPRNVSSPHDLARMVAAAAAYPLIREFSTASERYVEVGGRQLRFGNTNGLVRQPDWSISVSKTGYISEAGRCLVMQTWLEEQPVVMVLMDSSGTYTRTADAKRVRKWLESDERTPAASVMASRNG